MFVCGTRPRPRAGFLLVVGGEGGPPERAALHSERGADMGRTSGPVQAKGVEAMGAAKRRGGTKAEVAAGAESGGPGAERWVRRILLQTPDSGPRGAKKRLPIGRKGRRISGRQVFSGTSGAVGAGTVIGWRGRQAGAGELAVAELAMPVSVCSGNAGTPVTAGRQGPGLPFGPQCRPVPRGRCWPGQYWSGQYWSPPHCRFRPELRLGSAFRCRPG